MMKYRLSKIKIFLFDYECWEYTEYKFSHYEYRIEKKGLFGWKSILDKISDKEEGLRLLKELKGEQK